MYNRSNKLLHYILPGIFILLYLPVFSQEPGIQFEHGLSWNAIKEKAKKENKFIFLDCYTSWCGPCKMMARQIFPQQKVGEFFNQHFLNVKAQLDKSPNDNEEIKAWYDDAAFLAKEYKVMVYPTYLYFNPDGKLVHMNIGSTETGEEFIRLSSAALDPATQYFTRLETEVKEAENGNPEKLKEIAREARKKYDVANASRLSAAYLARTKDAFTKENLTFFNDLTEQSSDAAFRLFIDQTDKVNAVMGKGFAQKKVTTVAFLETGVYDYLRNRSKGKLDTIEQKIRQKFPSMAGLLIRKLKVESAAKEDWPNEVTGLVKEYGNEINAQELANYASSLSRAGEKAQQLIAMEWAAEAWKLEASQTTGSVYATILYKNGEKENAISIQKKVLELGKGKERNRMTGYYEETLAKMEKGEKL